MGQYYKAFDQQLESNFGFVFYDFFRNGLAHEYFAKGDFKISSTSNTGRGVGFHKKEVPTMANEPYYKDLLDVLNNYLSLLDM